MSGWPWPLDAVQGWFNGLWNWVFQVNKGTEVSSSAWIGGFTGWLGTQVKEFGRWIVDGIVSVIEGATDLVNEIRLALENNVLPALSSLGTEVANLIQTVVNAVTAGLEQAGKTLQNMGSVLMGAIWGWVDGALRWASDTFLWLQREIADTGAYVVDQISTAFDGAVGGLVETFAGWPRALSTAFNGVFDYLLDSLGAVAVEKHSPMWIYTKKVPGPVVEQVGWLEGVIGGGIEAGVKWLLNALGWISQTVAGAMDAVRKAIAPVVEPPLRALIESATAAVTPGSPPEEVEKATQEFSTKLLEKIESLIPKHKSPLPTLAELLAASAGVVGMNMLTVFGMDSIATYLDLAHPMKMTGIMHVAGDMLNSLNFPSMIGPILFSNIYAGIIVPLRYRWNEMYQHMLPPAPDLIRMVVREAFVPEMVIEAPEEFTAHMRYHGFAKEWSDRYWTAHFVPIALTQAYANLYRGYWTEEQFKHALLIADIHPQWWDDIYNVAYRPMGRYELRFAWEQGLVDSEKLVEAFMAMGLSPDDAVIAAQAQVGYALNAERNAVISEWRLDFEAGLITEDTFRFNLADINVIADRQDYYVARATIHRERAQKKDLLDLYRDGYMKDMITDEELRDRVLELLVIPDVADLFVEKAYVDKYKRPLPPRETEEEKALKELQKYQITYAIQAYRKFAVEKPELVEILVDAGVDPAVAATRADYEELKRPVPKPSAAAVAEEKEAARIQTLEVNRAVEEFRGYAIDEDTLLNRLVEVGLSEELATARMQLESIRRPPPPIPPEEVERARVAAEVQRLTGLALEAQYRRYAIEKAALIDGLVAAGFDPAEAAARADYEEARRPTPKPSAEERAAAKEEALIRDVQERIAKLEYRKYLIEAPELRKLLVDLGFSDEAADAMVRLEELTRPTPKPTAEEISTAKEETRSTRLKEATAVNEYVKGLISDAELTDRLEGLGYGADLVAAIVAGAQVRTFKPPSPPPAPVVREAPVSTLLRAFRLDLISAEDLMAELVRRGYSEESARLMVDVEAAKKT